MFEKLQSYYFSSDLQPSRRQKENPNPILKNYIALLDADSKEHIDNPTVVNSKPGLTRRRKAVIWVCWFLISYLVAEYTLGFVFDNDSHAISTLRSTAARTYSDLKEAYENFKHPQSKEEVVGIMTEFYELLAEMGYYDSDIIEGAPHQHGINRTLAQELKYSTEAIEMMDLLPYLNIMEKGEGTWAADLNVFLLYGEFADLRDDEMLVQCRDPMFTAAYDEEGRPIIGDGYGYMSPDHICLMLVGNHGSIMVLDAKTREFHSAHELNDN
jgi:hypothetical protein